MKKEILIADDHAIVRRGLKQILKEELTEYIIEEAASGTELLKKIRDGKWELVISDLSMPGKSGLEVLKVIREEFPKLPFLILSIHPENQYAIRVMKAGASGYLTKESAPEELVKAVKQILAGRKYITSSLAEKLADNLISPADGDLHQSLSDREFEVLRMLAAGKTVTEIADAIHLSVPTISTYRIRVLDKMHFKNNAELMHYVMENKIL
jgi:DNA-binding NarL/FixJ family response regulator